MILIKGDDLRAETDFETDSSESSLQGSQWNFFISFVTISNFDQFLRISFSLLPAPSAPVWDRDEERAREKASKPSTALASATRSAPPYGQRKSWIPR